MDQEAQRNQIFDQLRNNLEAAQQLARNLNTLGSKASQRDEIKEMLHDITNLLRELLYNVDEKTGELKCYCGWPVGTYVSKQENENYGRPFIRCPRSREEGCNFFEWLHSEHMINSNLPFEEQEDY